MLGSILRQFDMTRLLFLAMSAAASLLCITFHELCHGLAACRLGDPTARNAGRLTLNPLSHIDPIGLLLLVVVHVGWAKPVPVNMRYFRNPKRDMALTALAGPAANFVMALAALGLGSLIYYFAPAVEAAAWLMLFFCYIAVLSVGLGLFNLIPIPPLDGSKVLFALLPDRVYYAYLRYERYLMLLVVALAWLGAFSGPLDVCMGWVLEKLCALTRFPFALLRYYFGF